MKRTLKDNKRCGQLSSNETLFDDIWFNRMKSAEEANAEAVDYCGPVKTSHNVFCPAKLKS